MKKLDPARNEWLMERGIYGVAAIGTIPVYFALALVFPDPALHDTLFGASALIVLGFLLTWSRRETERYRIEWEAEQHPADPRLHPDEVAIRIRRRQLLAVAQILVFALIGFRDRRWLIPLGAALALWMIWSLRQEVTRVRRRDEERAREGNERKAGATDS